jgi:glycosyltransferase involved in cell wall biosynthesis
MPFHLNPEHPAFFFHQSMIQSRLIASALDHVGYRVDVVDHTRQNDIPHKSYGIVISHNSTINPNHPSFEKSTKIYLASGTEHKIHNERQTKRLNDFTSRKGQHDIELIWDIEEMAFTDGADAIFCFGNDAVADTWRTRFTCPVFAFHNTALREINYLRNNLRTDSKHFLFLGSRQQLAKGLDLLLESFFETPDLHLHICGHYLKDRGFCRAYEKILFNSRNIHSHGWVDVTSRRFKEIASKCMFTISASCAEGSPGSITNAMKLGIIPILAREAGINGDDGVIIMNDLSIEGIKYMIRKCSTETPERLSKLSLEATQRAERDFTESAFKKRWIEMIEDVVRTAIMNDQKQ